MIIKTAQFRYAGPDRLDITVKGQHPFGRHFAPTWEMVWDSKKGKISEDEYTARYVRILRTDKLHELATVYKQITLVCYCAAGAFCHRVILAELLESMKLGTYIGEVPLGNYPKVYSGDLTLIGRGIICHQVNCRGKMGAGLALAIRKAYPAVYDVYMQFLREGRLQLGVPFLVKIHEHLYIANLPAQYDYGRTKRHTNYEALRNCLKAIKQVRENLPNHLPVLFPEKMGCSLGGGDWYLVSKMIQNIIPDAVFIRKEG